MKDKTISQEGRDDGSLYDIHEGERSPRKEGKNRRTKKEKEEIEEVDDGDGDV